MSLSLPLALKFGVVLCYQVAQVLPPHTSPHLLHPLIVLRLVVGSGLCWWLVKWGLVGWWSGDEGCVFDDVVYIEYEAWFKMICMWECGQQNIESNKLLILYTYIAHNLKPPHFHSSHVEFQLLRFECHFDTLPSLSCLPSFHPLGGGGGCWNVVYMGGSHKSCPHTHTSVEGDGGKWIDDEGLNASFYYLFNLWNNIHAYKFIEKNIKWNFKTKNKKKQMIK